MLGEILEKSRPDDALICFVYATQLAREEQEVAKIRIHLAHRLALAKRYAEAARQTSLALKYREQSGYPTWTDVERASIHVVGRVIWFGRSV